MWSGELSHSIQSQIGVDYHIHAVFCQRLGAWRVLLAPHSHNQLQQQQLCVLNPLKTDNQHWAICVAVQRKQATGARGQSQSNVLVAHDQSLGDHHHHHSQTVSTAATTKRVRSIETLGEMAECVERAERLRQKCKSDAAVAPDEHIAINVAGLEAHPAKASRRGFELEAVPRCEGWIETA